MQHRPKVFRVSVRRRRNLDLLAVIRETNPKNRDRETAPPMLRLQGYLEEHRAHSLQTILTGDEGAGDFRVSR